MVKNPPATANGARDTSSIPGMGRSSGIGNGKLLQYSCLQNSMYRNVWWGHKEMDMTEQLNRNIYSNYRNNNNYVVLPTCKTW